MQGVLGSILILVGIGLTSISFKLSSTSKKSINGVHISTYTVILGLWIIVAGMICLQHSC